MMVKREDLMITYETEECYRVYVRKKVLFFFSKWIPVTYQEAENSKEEFVEFKSFKEAELFLSNIVY